MCIIHCFPKNVIPYASIVSPWRGSAYVLRWLQSGRDSRGYGIPIGLFLLGWIKLIPYVMHITMQLGQSSFST